MPDGMAIVRARTFISSALVTRVRGFYRSGGKRRRRAGRLMGVQMQAAVTGRKFIRLSVVPTPRADSLGSPNVVGMSDLDLLHDIAKS